MGDDWPPADIKQKLHDLQLRDATVRAAFKHYEFTNLTTTIDYASMLEALVVVLATEKGTIMENYQTALNTSIAPRPMVMPEGWKVSDEQHQAVDALQELKRQLLAHGFFGAMAYVWFGMLIMLAAIWLSGSLR